MKTAFALALALMTAASPPAIADGPGLDGDPPRITVWIDSLRSPNKAEWRKAQIRLACSGPAALDALESSDLIVSEPVQSRVRLLLSLAMLTTITTKDLDRHPRLHQLVDEDLARASAFAVPYETNDIVRGVMPAELARHGGFAVPAALTLCRSPRPAARGYGIVFLKTLRATVAIDSLKRLMGDEEEYHEAGSDYLSTGSPGQSARDAIRYLSGQQSLEARLVTMDILNDAYDGLCDLINGIRSVAGYNPDRSWDEWWVAADPVWIAWWRLAQGAERPPDRQAWLDWLNESEGYRYFAHAAAGDTRLVVTGPRGTRGRVRSGSQTLAAGELPIRLIATTDSAFVGWWNDGMPPSVERYLDIEATLPNGTQWQCSVTVQHQMETRVELLPAPRKAAPAKP